jgi:hypothetical protein
MNETQLEICQEVWSRVDTVLHKVIQECEVQETKNHQRERAYATFFAAIFFILKNPENQRLEDSLKEFYSPEKNKFVYDFLLDVSTILYSTEPSQFFKKNILDPRLFTQGEQTDSQVMAEAQNEYKLIFRNSLKVFLANQQKEGLLNPHMVQACLKAVLSKTQAQEVPAAPGISK